MFGLDEAEAEKIRRGGPSLRWWVVLLQLLLAAPVVLLGALLSFLNDPPRIQAELDKATENAKFTLSFDDVTFLPLGLWYEPRTWQLVVSEFTFRPKDPTKAMWSAGRIQALIPYPVGVGDKWGLHFRHGLVTDLKIVAFKQRPPPPWTPAEPMLALLSGDRIDVRRGSFSAPEDPPIGRAEVQGIHGVVRNIRYLPGTREVSADGQITVRSFTTGNVTATRISLPVFKIERSTMNFAGDFCFGEACGTLEGRIRDFHIKSAVNIKVDLRDVPVDEVVRTATGEDSPVDGRLDLVLSVEAGGSRPRGASEMNGTARLRDGRILLDRKTRYVVLDLIRLAPWVKLDAYNRVLLGDMQGRIRLSRGEANLKELTYPAGRRTLRIDGTISSDMLHLMVRLLPRDPDSDRIGLGVVLTGSADSQKVRLVRRADVDRPDPWMPLVVPDRVLEADGTDAAPKGLFNVFRRKDADKRKDGR